MRFGHFSRQLKGCNGLFACDRREVVQEVVEGISGCEIVVEGLHRHSRADKNGDAAHDFRVAMNDGWLARHEYSFATSSICPGLTRRVPNTRVGSANGLPASSCWLFTIEHDDLIEHLAARVNTGDGGCQHLAVL